MTSFLNKKIIANKGRSSSISFEPKDNLINHLKMSDKKYILKNHIKKFTSDNHVNENQSKIINYKYLFEKKKNI